MNSDRKRPGEQFDESRRTFSSLSHSFQRWADRLISVSIRLSPFILAVVLVITGLRTYQLIHQTTGGDDLLLSDIPKSIMLLHGQDPYSVRPWSAPYPPLLFVVVAGIIQATSANLLQSPGAIAIIDQNVRVAGIFASALVSIIIFVSLRFRVGNNIAALILASLFVTLPSHQQYAPLLVPQ
jgi:hypothetical protein